MGCVLCVCAEGCVNGCNGHGECVAGQCKCSPGYDGEFCNQSKSLRFKIYNILMRISICNSFLVVCLSFRCVLNSPWFFVISLNDICSRPY